MFTFQRKISNGVYARHLTSQIKVGDVGIGGDAPISVQSMTNTDTRDVTATCQQIKELSDVGCEIVRVAVPDNAAAQCLPEIIRNSPIPVIADVHFQPELAHQALEAGVHCLRINPGTIADQKELAAIAEAAGKKRTPIRIGVNGGSIEKELMEKYGSATPQALTESALNHCAFFEKHNCSDLKVSLKSSTASVTIAACRLFAQQSNHPLHIGVTEAGTIQSGTVKSAVAIGTLLMEGIGDTIRVSLSAHPVQEVLVAQRILEACGLRDAQPELISCPTCGRTEIDLIPMVTEVEKELQRLKSEGLTVHLKKVAVMGCSVNGPGEAKDADLGIAGGQNKGVLFKNGKIVASYPEKELVPALIEEIYKYTT